MVHRPAAAWMWPEEMGDSRMARKSMARRLLIAGLALAAAPGCWSTASDADTSRAMNRQMERMERMGEDLARREPGGVVRSQAPGESRIPPAPSTAGQSRVNLTPGAPGESRVNQAEAQVAQTPQPIGPPVILSTSASDQPKPAAKVASPVAPITGQAQVRVVANVGNTPIYDSEVREAVNQRLQELLATLG